MRNTVFYCIVIMREPSYRRSTQNTQMCTSSLYEGLKVSSNTPPKLYRYVIQFVNCLPSPYAIVREEWFGVAWLVHFRRSWSVRRVGVAYSHSTSSRPKTLVVMMLVSSKFGTWKTSQFIAPAHYTLIPSLRPSFSFSLSNCHCLSLALVSCRSQLDFS